MRALVSSAFLAFCTVAFAVSPEAGIWLGPVGEMVYADGTALAGGERYVVTFTAEGSSFSGFTADGHLADPSHSVVATWGTIDELYPSGIQWTLGTKAEIRNWYLDDLGCSNGVFELCFLDTRDGDGFAAVDKSTKLPTKINGWAKAEGANSISFGDLEFSTDPEANSGSITTAQKTTIVPIAAATPTPVISSFVHSAGGVTVCVTNTAASCSYVLKRASDVEFSADVWTSSAKDGADAADAPISFSDSDSPESKAFYRIEVVE